MIQLGIDTCTYRDFLPVRPLCYRVDHEQARRSDGGGGFSKKVRKGSSEV